MIRALLKLDGALAWSRPAWLWAGQLAVIALGVHLAADRIDDLLLGWLTPLDLPWPDPEMPLDVSGYTALFVELASVLTAGWLLARARATPPRGWREVLGRVSITGVVGPLFWIPTALAGTWVVGMATEDLVASVAPGAAQPVAIVLAALVGVRLALTGAWRVTACSPCSKHYYDGLLVAPMLLIVAGIAGRYGLPLWGWLQ